MFVDPKPPEEQHIDEKPPPSPPGEALDIPRAWTFNPDYVRLIEAWKSVMPHLEILREALDKAYDLARSPQTWDAPVGERHVEEIREWRTRLASYRHAVLTAISDEEVDTPRWVQTSAHAPHILPR